MKCFSKVLKRHEEQEIIMEIDRKRNREHPLLFQEDNHVYCSKPLNQYLNSQNVLFFFLWRYVHECLGVCAYLTMPRGCQAWLNVFFYERPLERYLILGFSCNILISHIHYCTHYYTLLYVIVWTINYKPLDSSTLLKAH